MADALPPLRNDLQLLPGPRARDGSATWTLHDPARGRFFRIGWLEFEILARWAPGSADNVAARVDAETPFTVTPDEVAGIGRFLEQNDLSAAGSANLGARLADQVERAQKGPLSWLLHNYLFLRIPLVRPDRFLDATLPYVRAVFSPWFPAAVMAIALLALMLVVRQWEHFAATFLYFFSWEGAVYYAIALVVAKLVHELGHAYTAKHYGLRVPSMGIAFLVMFPVLYTDTGEAWRLTRRRPVLAIGFAGMAAELTLAALSLLAWGLLPEGPLKSAMFFLATTSWLMALVVNLNPFMRFDGYYLLSDYLQVPNLQERAFALARWRLREGLFGLKAPCPEHTPLPHYRTLLLYAYGTWIYRFFLFLGIAVLIYLMFFKVLGIFLMIVELWWFIARPIARELAEWWRQRGKVGINRHVVLTFGVSILGMLALFLPWRSTLTLPAIFHAGNSNAIYTPIAARVAAIHVENGDRVTEGDPLFRLVQPDLDFRAAQQERQIETLKWRIARASGRLEANDQTQVLSQQLVRSMTALEGIEKERGELTLTAPFSGTVRDVDPELYRERWLPHAFRVATLVADTPPVATAYIGEEDLARIATDTEAWFRAEGDILPPLRLTLRSIDTSSTATLERPYLASEFGGPLAARHEPESGALIPRKSLYRLRLQADPDVAPPRHVVRGTLYLEGEAASLAGRVFRFAAGVLIRESGF